MQGMRFLIVTEKGPVNHGIIAQQITPEKYLCNFAKQPASSRVCDIEEVQQWNLFPTDNSMNAFISAIQQQNAAPTETPPKIPGAPKKKAKKKVAKKTSKPRVAKKKANAKTKR